MSSNTSRVPLVRAAFATRPSPCRQSTYENGRVFRSWKLWDASGGTTKALAIWHGFRFRTVARVVKPSNPLITEVPRKTFRYKTAFVCAISFTTNFVTSFCKMCHLKPDVVNKKISINWIRRLLQQVTHDDRTLFFFIYANLPTSPLPYALRIGFTWTKIIYLGKVGNRKAFGLFVDFTKAFLFILLSY